MTPTSPDFLHNLVAARFLLGLLIYTFVCLPIHLIWQNGVWRYNSEQCHIAPAFRVLYTFSNFISRNFFQISLYCCRYLFSVSFNYAKFLLSQNFYIDSVLFMENFTPAGPSLKQILCHLLRETCPGTPLSISISSYLTAPNSFLS